MENSSTLGMAKADLILVNHQYISQSYQVQIKKSATVHLALSSEKSRYEYSFDTCYKILTSYLVFYGSFCKRYELVKRRTCSNSLIFLHWGKHCGLSAQDRHFQAYQGCSGTSENWLMHTDFLPFVCNKSNMFDHSSFCLHKGVNRDGDKLSRNAAAIKWYNC